MTKDHVIILLALTLFLCLTILIIGTLYFLREWKKLDSILDSFWKNAPENAYGQEYYETRESRVASQLRRILSSARFRENQAVKEKDQVTELISDLSHQLKTPLANIVMNMEILQNDALTEKEHREFLEHTKSQADKMTWLMKNLLKASRLENGIIQFDAEYTGIKETIARALEAVYAQAAAKNILLSAEEFPDFSLYHNPKWTAEAMSNILENAIKYSPENSRIQITVEWLDIYTQITITDEGVGIPENDYNNIFKRFYRGENVAQLDGNGLGLYLAQLILQHEKGYITVASKIGQGSSFSLFLLNTAP
ncbi:MAG: HAMP domain-containing histidine kinase [Bacillus sp. (in: Bacteria)]|nr:HAMP domain-containing histidine kinase [Bacillus sp. (in: firmicutes)]MCM1426620.1 HAMP domain-containing histidine kinase [Eubacterium sp.]